jgi:hypothetical protein
MNPSFAVQYQYGDTNPVVAPILTAQAVNIGDIVGLDTGVIIRAEDEAWDTNLATTQTNWAVKYLGASGQFKEAGSVRIFGNSTDNIVRVDTSAVFEYPCDSASYVIGDLVGPAKAAGNALLSQQVAKVASLALAIGVVTQDAPSASKVLVRLLSTILPLSK